jgi:hypothetical protein
MMQYEYLYQQKTMAWGQGFAHFASCVTLSNDNTDNTNCINNTRQNCKFLNLTAAA